MPASDLYGFDLTTAYQRSRRQPKVVETVWAWPRGGGATELRLWRDRRGMFRLSVWVDGGPFGWLCTRRAVRLRRRELRELGQALVAARGGA